MTWGAAKMRKTFFCMALVLMTAAPSQAQACADVAIVFAIDGSDSITDEEYAFEKRAIVSALRDESVLSVLKSAGMVAVSAVFWGDSALPVQKIDWFFIDKGRGSETFARESATSVPSPATPISAMASGRRWTCLPILDCVRSDRSSTFRETAGRLWGQCGQIWFRCIMHVTVPNKCT